MEKRIGTVLILIENHEVVQLLNSVLTKHNAIIIGRQGISFKEKDIAIISLIIEGSTDEIGSLTGQLGKIKGVKVKSILIKN